MIQAGQGATIVPGWSNGQLITLVAIVTALALAAFLLRVSSARRRTIDRRARLRDQPLEARLDRLSRSMGSSARLVEEISAELAARAAAARQLQEDAEAAEALAALHKDQAEAVRRMLDAELETQAKGIRSDAIKIGIAGLLVGSGVTFLVTLLVHPLH